MSRPYFMPFARIPEGVCGDSDHGGVDVKSGVYVKVDALVALLTHEAEHDEEHKAGQVSEDTAKAKAHAYAALRLSMLGEDIARGAARFEVAAERDG